MKVRHKKSGLIYRLIKNKEGYYLSCNDGMVPSGQQLHGTLEEIIQDYSFEIVDDLTKEDIQNYGTEDEKIFLEIHGYTTLDDSLKGLSIAVRNKNWRAAEVWLKDMLSRVLDLKGERNEI